ncbi:hypothetical protein C8F04DRAFT_1193563 [Mycena alexandri]|uniref:Uncharacterized protein n=1 Tax=Mycena alexandri TaxID=1745969 RepID=A0AAD6SAC7_9AGAR|nr:hypothetical protein C8F04DRAFT_1193563 [Mycena alexandri]
MISPEPWAISRRILRRMRMRELQLVETSHNKEVDGCILTQEREALAGRSSSCPFFERVVPSYRTSNQVTLPAYRRNFRKGQDQKYQTTLPDYYSGLTGLTCLETLGKKCSKIDWMSVEELCIKPCCQQRRKGAKGIKRRLRPTIDGLNSFIATSSTRNAEAIREKNRLSLCERRAAAKAKKRQWDPPRKGDVQERAILEEGSRRSPSFDINLVSDEILNAPLHFKDYRGAPSSDDDSAFRRMDARRRIPTESSEVNAAPQSVHTTSEERVAIEVLATMGGRAVGGSDASILRRADLLSSDECVPALFVSWTHGNS